MDKIRNSDRNSKAVNYIIHEKPQIILLEYVDVIYDSTKLYIQIL